MKRFLAIVSVAAVLALTPVIAFAQAAKYQLGIDGLACPFCAYGIEKKLLATEGVKEIDVDIDAGSITVTMMGGAIMTQGRARQVVEDAGFTLKRFEKLSSGDSP